VVVIPAANTDLGAQLLQPNRIDTLIIDRQPLFLAALGRLLEGPPLRANVLTAGRSDLGLELVKTQRLDLIFCELHAEPLSGAAFVRALQDEGLTVPVILLGDELDAVPLAAALATNAAGLFTKNASVDEFLVGVRAVVSGHRAVGAGLFGRLLDRLREPAREERKQGTDQLSPTELEILALIGQAQSIPDIAASRGISHKTVRNHLAKIYRKLELHGRAEAVLWAARMGLNRT
jgi:DNA-binding NarL/FixJ family response regulator